MSLRETILAICQDPARFPTDRDMSIAIQSTLSEYTQWFAAIDLYHAMPAQEREWSKALRIQWLRHETHTTAMVHTRYTWTCTSVCFAGLVWAKVACMFAVPRDGGLEDPEITTCIKMMLVDDGARHSTQRSPYHPTWTPVCMHTLALTVFRCMTEAGASLPRGVTTPDQFLDLVLSMSFFARLTSPHRDGKRDCCTIALRRSLRGTPGEYSQTTGSGTINPPSRSRIRRRRTLSTLPAFHQCDLLPRTRRGRTGGDDDGNGDGDDDGDGDADGREGGRVHLPSL